MAYIMSASASIAIFLFTLLHLNLLTTLFASIYYLVFTIDLFFRCSFLLFCVRYLLETRLLVWWWRWKCRINGSYLTELSNYLCALLFFVRLNKLAFASTIISIMSRWMDQRLRLHPKSNRTIVILVPIHTFIKNLGTFSHEFDYSLSLVLLHIVYKGSFRLYFKW